MLSENESRYDPMRSEPVFILGVVFLVFLLITMCVLGILLVNQMKEPRPIVQQNVPVILIPAALPTSAPRFLIRLPVVLAEPQFEPETIFISVSEQNWKVTKIDTSGYALNGQYYDLATFTRLDGQITVQGYCINPGWDIPDIGAEYSLSPEDIFVPLYEQIGDPLQRFSKIQ